MVRGRPFGHARRHEKHYRQLPHRLGAPLIREVPATFRGGELSALAAAEQHGLGRTRFFELYADYLRACATGHADTWTPGCSGGDHHPEWSAEVTALITKLLSAKPPCSYSAVASELHRWLNFQTNRASVRRWALQDKLAPDTRSKAPPKPIKRWQARDYGKSKGLSSAGVRVSILDFFRQQGIDEGRIELLSWTPSVGEHLALYHRIDIALDTFPYHGTTTTCEALWMGVPVITLAGSAHTSRVGTSLLSNVGIPEFIASSGDKYVSIAGALSGDRTKLQSLRENLRDMMIRSPLMDAGRFVKNLEAGYRMIWEALSDSL